VKKAPTALGGAVWLQRGRSFKEGMLMNHHQFRWLLNVYPPYLGAGVRVRHLSEDYRDIVVEMPLTFLNRNYVGTHFGGSLYSMVDPFYMLMLIKNLGPDYIVWDKAASIDFVKPGRGTVRARFHLDEETLRDIRRKVAERGKVLPTFTVEVVDESGDVVARIEKVLYIRKKTP
jgi:acyl-coenzyme A thioesterase PaaI-like protein